MAGCVTSNITTSSWSATRCWSVRCCGQSRRTSSARCASSAWRAGRRPWLLRLGLFLYDHIGGRNCSATRTLDLSKDETA